MPEIITVLWNLEAGAVFITCKLVTPFGNRTIEKTVTVQVDAADLDTAALLGDVVALVADKTGAAVKGATVRAQPAS